VGADGPSGKSSRSSSRPRIRSTPTIRTPRRSRSASSAPQASPQPQRTTPYQGSMYISMSWPARAGRECQLRYRATLLAARTRNRGTRSSLACRHSGSASNKQIKFLVAGDRLHDCQEIPAQPLEPPCRIRNCRDQRAAARRAPVESRSVTAAVSQLKRRTSVGDDGGCHSDADGAVAYEPPQVRVFDSRVGDQQHQVGGAVCGDDALGGRQLPMPPEY
jgi:hypothetical protein